MWCTIYDDRSVHNGNIWRVHAVWKQTSVDTNVGRLTWCHTLCKYGTSIPKCLWHVLMLRASNVEYFIFTFQMWRLTNSHTNPIHSFIFATIRTKHPENNSDALYANSTHLLRRSKFAVRIDAKCTAHIIQTRRQNGVVFSGHIDFQWHTGRMAMARRRIRQSFRATFNRIIIPYRKSLSINTFLTPSTPRAHQFSVFVWIWLSHAKK